MKSLSCQRDQLFISYSHADRPWVDRLQTMIRPLVRSEALRLWDDSSIPPGAKWRAEIEKALATAKVALLLVSAEFLASEFVTNRELPALLEAAEQEGLRILWVCLSPCFYEATPIGDYQAVLDPRQLLEEMSPVQQRGALKTIAEAIRDALLAEPAVPGPFAVPPAFSVPLQRFPTTTCLLRRDGDRWRMDRRPVQAEGYREELAPGVALSMVRIPAGSFRMGSPQDEPESRDSEGPQHRVTLGPFSLGQTPITQAQWRAVALWEQVECALEPDPSEFKGPNRPVEKVSWHEAVEFCYRLSRHTHKRYGLPSEAQWEYACRAGSTTPFHFGATLTSELANYDGTSTYGDGPKGTYREQTTDVASFPANAWGLQDMHGNVWEWCADHWHPSYDFAPWDDQPWLIPAADPQEHRLLRGGSWFKDPGCCRSACRDFYPPYFDFNYLGFRVCCLPQDQFDDPSSLAPSGPGVG